MAVAAVGGAANASAVAVTTLSVTYSPTAANVVVVFVSLGGAPGTAVIVKDSAGNQLLQGPNGIVNNLSAWYQLNVPAGITGYTATWQNAQQASIGVEEYSNAGSTPEVNTIDITATGNSATGAVTYAMNEPNNFIVAGAASVNTMTASAGSTQRQQTTVGTGRLTIVDNTNASIGNVTCTVTQTSTPWGMIAMEIGGPGRARKNQNINLVAQQRTSANARAPQNLILVARQPNPNPHARVLQNLLLVARQKVINPPPPPPPPPGSGAPQRSPLVDPYIEAMDVWYAAIENLTAEGDCNSINIPWLLALSVTQGNGYTVAIAQHRWTFEPEWGFDITGAGKGSMYGSGGQGSGQGGLYVSW